MSTTIDQKVVEMQFDNRKFESNVKTSMSTLDRLKEKLNFKGAADGLRDVETRSNKLTFRPLANRVETVTGSFSSMEQVAISAFDNIIMSGKRAGESLIRSLSVRQISVGWNKYAEKTSSVQTIMSATAKDFDDVNEQMEYVNDQMTKLNWFTDETSYSFVDMTNNIGKFTSNGVKLDSAVTAMQGIATWAAKSGANVNDASRAMYNLSQAISVGGVKLIDWKSIENANMATYEFKETAIQTAVELGTLKKVGDGLYETLKGNEVSVTNFNENLSDMWFSSEVLLKTLDRYGGFTNELHEAYEETGLLTSQLLDYVEAYKEGTFQVEDIIKKEGLSMSAERLTEIISSLASETNEFGFKAFKAAQEAKTFQEAIDATKDAVSTGWMNTFELLFGDYLHAKTLWSSFAEDLYTIFAEGGERRNNILAETMSSSWEDLRSAVLQAGITTTEFTEALKEAAKEHGIAIDEMIEKEGSFEATLKHGWLTNGIVSTALKKFTTDVKTTVKETTKSVKELEDITKRVVLGEFGNGEARIKALTAAGWDAAKVQKMVNDLVYEGKVNYEDYLEEVTSVKGMTDEQKASISELIEALDDEESEISQLVKMADGLSGRDLFVGTFQNIMNLITGTMRILRDAYAEINDETSVATGLRRLLSSLYAITSVFNRSKERTEALTEAFAGLFSITAAIRKSLVAVTKGVFKGLREGLSKINIDIDATLIAFGEFGRSIRQWFEDNQIYAKLSEHIANAISLMGAAIGNVIDRIRESKTVQAIVTSIKTAFVGFFKVVTSVGKSRFEYLGELFEKLAEAETLSDVFTVLKDSATDLFDRLIDSAQNGIKRLQEFINTVKETHQISIGKFTINLNGEFTFISKILKKLSDSFSGLKVFIDTTAEGMTDTLAGFSDDVGGILGRIVKAFKSINFTELIGLVMGGGMIYASAQAATAVTNITNIFEPLTIIPNFMADIGAAMGNIGKAMKYQAWAKMITSFAGAIAVLALSLAALTLVDQSKIYSAAGMLSVLIGVTAISLVYLTKATQGVGTDFVKVMLGITGSFLLLVLAFGAIAKAAATIVASGTGDDVIGYFVALVATFLRSIGAIMAMISFFGLNAKTSIGRFTSLISFGVLFAIMGKVMANMIERVNGVEVGDIKKAMYIMAGMMGLILSVATLGKKIHPGTAIGLAATLFIIQGLIKVIVQITEIDPKAILSHLSSYIIIFGIIGGIMLAATKVSKGAAEAAIAVLGAAAAMVIIINTIKKLQKVDLSNISITATAVVLLGALAGIIRVSKFAGEAAHKAGIMLLGVAVAMIALTASVVVLSHLDLEGLLGALIAVMGMLTAMALVIASTRVIAGEHVAPAIYAFATTIGMIVVALSVLSFIDVKNLYSATGALIASVMAIFLTIGKASNIKFDPKSLMTFIGLMAAIVISLRLLALSDWKNILAGAAGLSMVMVVLSAVVSKFAIAPTISIKAVAGLALVAVIMGGLLALVAKISAANVDPSSILVLSTSLSLMIASLSLLIKAVGNRLVSFGSLQTVVNVLGGAALVIGLVGFVAVRIQKMAPDIWDAIMNALPIVREFFEGLGSIFGGLIKGVLKGIDPKAVEKIGGSLISFTDNLKSFVDGASGLDSSKVESLGNFMKALKSFAAAGIINKIFGRSTFSDLSDNLSGLGTAIKNFNDETKDLSEDDVNHMTAVSNVRARIADAVKYIPKTGGFIQSIAGAADLEKYGLQLEAYGKSLKTFAGSVSEISEDDVTHMGRVATAAVDVNKIGQNVPKSSGWIQTIAGKTDLETFGSALAVYGNSLKQFGINVRGIKSDDIDKINDVSGMSANIGSLRQMLKENSGNIKSIARTAAESGSEETINSAFIFMGSVMSTIATSFAGISFDKVNNASKYGDLVAPLEKILGFFTSSAVMNIGNGDIGKNIDDYRDHLDKAMLAFRSLVTHLNYIALDEDQVNKVSTISEAAKTIVSDIVTIIKTLSDVTDSEYEVFATRFGMLTDVVALATTLGSGINEEDVAKVTTLGQTILDSIVETMTDEKLKTFEELYTKFVTAFTDSLDTILDKIKEFATDFYDAGKNLVEGFARGITENTNIAIDAAVALGNEAATRLKEQSLDEHSPSKVTEGIGNFFSMGFIEGIKEKARGIKAAAFEAGENAKSGLFDSLKESISGKISEFLGGNLDLNPIISPVLDLTNLQSGVSNISGLLNSGSFNLSRTGLNLSSISGNFKESLTSSEGLTKLLNGSQSRNISFTQNNYSPKALSRMEIYRQTQNLTSMIKGRGSR